MPKILVGKLDIYVRNTQGVSDIVRWKMYAETTETNGKVIW